MNIDIFLTHGNFLYIFIRIIMIMNCSTKISKYCILQFENLLKYIC